MGGESVYSNWSSWVMAAKKLYFIRSCSSSWRVRSLAESSSWRCISSATLRSSMWLAWVCALRSISGKRSAVSVRHSRIRGLKVPHWPPRIISTALAWVKAGL